MPGRVLLVAVSLLSIASLPLAAAEQDAVAYITARYADTPEPGAKARYSPRIVKLWAACTKKEKKTGEPCMDFDIWVNAQDWEIKNLKIEPLTSDARTAGVLASFDNLDRHEDINFRLIKDKKGWTVDDISTGCDMLSDVLKGKTSTC
ncbi:MAG: hypothetical protein WBQ82_10980 [Methyloceanibacter sp.]